MIDFALMDRLKVLNFDEEFRRQIKMRPMSRYYFMVESNPSEQFHIFTSLAAWLARKCGADLQPPLEDDDPNSTVSGILDATRSLGISVDFSPNKLKQGYGEHVVYLLEKLSEKAVQNSESRNWIKLDLKALETPGEAASDDEEPDEEDLEEVNELPEEVEYSTESDGEEMDNMILNSPGIPIDKTVKLTDWKEEVERAAPSLKIRIVPSARDWRTHTQQLVTHRKELGQLSLAVGDALQRTSRRASSAVEAVRSRQGLLQERTSGALDRLARLRGQATSALDSYKAASIGVTQRQEILSELTDKIESVKQKTEMKGSAMNDQSPIVNIKRAVVAMKKEIQEMDLQLAVLMWTVLKYQGRVKKSAL